jgi:OmcA/MtrC family decaheme c-type cytochrome
VNVKIDRIIDGTAGKTPTVQMIITDNQGQAVAPSALSRLTVRLNGPTSDYANAISESATAAGGNSSGYAWWTFANPIPADAKGSWSVSTEARRDVVLREGTATQATARASAKNSIVPFSVDGSPVKARRQVVATEKCNACHFNFSMHGGARNDTQLCSQCHNASLVYGTGAAAISLDFPVLVHRIHTGENLTRPYAVGTHNYNEVAYPGDRRVCSQCHVNGSENLPLQAGLRPVSDPGGPIKSLSVTAAACTGCHDTLAAASHVLANTTALGDSCEVCHGSDAEFSVARVHKR